MHRRYKSICVVGVFAIFFSSTMDGGKHQREREATGLHLSNLLLLASQYSNDFEGTKTALEGGADPNLVETILLDALKDNSEELVKLLLAYNADPSVISSDKEPILAIKDEVLKAYLSLVLAFRSCGQDGAEFKKFEKKYLASSSNKSIEFSKMQKNRKKSPNYQKSVKLAPVLDIAQIVSIANKSFPEKMYRWLSEMKPGKKIGLRETFQMVLERAPICSIGWVTCSLPLCLRSHRFCYGYGPQDKLGVAVLKAIDHYNEKDQALIKENYYYGRLKPTAANQNILVPKLKTELRKKLMDVFVYFK